MQRTKQLRKIMLAAGLLLWGGTQTATAQDPVQQDTLLPELVPQEVEILGDLEIAFPSIDRKPLAGFNPPPRIYEIPRGRRPFIDTYRQDPADLPASPLQKPEPPAAIPITGAPHRNGHLTVGFGRYLSRTVRTQATLPISGGNSVYGELAHDGWDSFKPFTQEQPDLKARSQHVDGRVGLNLSLGSLVAGIEGNGFFDGYDLYGAGLIDSTSTLFVDQPERDGFGLGTRAWIRTGLASRFPVELDVRYGGSRYKTKFYTDDREDPRFRRAEKRFDGKAVVGAVFGAGRVMVEGRLSKGGLDSDQSLSDDYQAHELGSTIQLEIDEMIRVQAGIRVLGYSASDRNVTRGPDSLAAGDRLEPGSEIAPVGRIDMYLHPRMHFYVKNDPRVEAHGLHDIYRANPFVVDEPVLKPNLSTIDAEGGGILYAGSLRLSLYGGIRRFSEYLFFEETDRPIYTSRYERGLFEARYEAARISYFGGNVSFSLPGRFSATFDVKARSSQLSDVPGDIPYFSALIGHLGVSYSFAEQRGLVQASGTLNGKRYADRAQTIELSSFLDLDVQALYYVLENVGIYAQIRSLSGGGYEQWLHYPSATWITMAGLRLRW